MKYLRLIGILLFIYILWSVDWPKIWSLVERIDILKLAGAMIVTSTMVLIKAWRWWYLMSMQNVRATFKDAVKIYFSAQYFGILTPARVGELLKIFYLKEYGLATKSVGLSSVLIDRLFDILVAFLMGFIGIWYFELFGPISWLFLVSAVIIGVFSLLFLHHRFAELILDTLFRFLLIRKFKSDADRILDSFKEATLQLLTPRLVFPFFFTIISYIWFFFGCWLLADSLGIDVSYWQISLFISIATLVSLIPVTISGIGTRDATLILLFDRIGTGQEAAVSFSVLLFAIFFLFLGAFGYLVWLATPMKTPNSNDLKLN